MYLIKFASAISRPQKVSEYVFFHMLSLASRFCVKLLMLLFALIGKLMEKCFDCSVFPSLYLLFKVVNVSLTWLFFKVGHCY